MTFAMLQVACQKTMTCYLFYKALFFMCEFGWVSTLSACMEIRNSTIFCTQNWLQKAYSL